LGSSSRPKVLARIRTRDAGHDVLGRCALALRAGLCVLAVRLRPAYVLGSADLDEFRPRARQARLPVDHLALLFLGALPARRAFAVFAGIGIALVAGDLAWRYFKDSWAFPITLSAIGIVFAGLWWSRHAARSTARLQERLPAPLRDILQRRQSQEHGG
jgi:hypothetical protein